jgi:hypothetical protein
MACDFIIELDDEFAKKIGFTSDLFAGYQWKIDNDIWISFIHSKYPGKGNFIRLLKNLENLGYNIKVPTPFPRMQEILEKDGFTKKTLFCEALNENITFWEKINERL